MNILISSGSCHEKIDDIRFIANISTGKTGSLIANYLFDKSLNIYFLRSRHSQSSNNPSIKEIIYDDFKSLEKQFYELLSKTHIDFVIHSAAVSDYSVDYLNVDGEKIYPDEISKIDSKSPNLIINMKKNPKIISKLREYSLNKNIKIFGFKLLNSNDIQFIKSKILDVFGDNYCDYVIFNNLNEISIEKHFFSIYNNELKVVSSGDTKLEMAKKIFCLIEESK